jgi:hypothetical protein
LQAATVSARHWSVENSLLRPPTRTSKNEEIRLSTERPNRSTIEEYSLSPYAHRRLEFKEVNVAIVAVF